MKTGLIYGYPNIPGNKKYFYHGTPRNCLIQPDIPPGDSYPHNIPLMLVFTIAYYNSTHTSVLLEGELEMSTGTPNCTWRGFEYRVVGSEYYNFVFEFGDFGEGLFQLLVTYPD